MEAPGLNPAHHPTLGKAHKKLGAGYTQSRFYSSEAGNSPALIVKQNLKYEYCVCAVKKCKNRQ